jgi:hypothetical protein
MSENLSSQGTSELSEEKREIAPREGRCGLLSYTRQELDNALTRRGLLRKEGEVCIILGSEIGLLLQLKTF